MADPPLQGTFTGNPVSLGLDENVQIVAPATDAESVMLPPVDGTFVELGVNEITSGGAALATFTLTAWDLMLLVPDDAITEKV